MQKILLFTDLHLKRNGNKIIGIDPVERFQNGLAHALANHSDADHLIILGDLTHNGHMDEYRILAEILSTCPIPITMLLGNHDRRENFTATFPDHPKTSAGFIQTSFQLGQHHLITLDTLKDPYARTEHWGKLCQTRRAWLDQTLAKTGGEPVLIFMHHPPFNVGFPGMDVIKLNDGDKFLADLNKHPNDCLLYTSDAADD